VSQTPPRSSVVVRVKGLLCAIPITLRILWQERYVRAAAALSVLVLVGGLEYYLANVPLPVDVPPGVQARGERDILVIENPDIRSAQDLVLSHVGRRGEAVDVYFDDAVFLSETLDLFHLLGLNPPESPGPIAYITKFSGKTRNDTCRTFVRGRLSNPGQPGTRLSFFQPRVADTERHRYLGIKASRSNLALEMNTIGPADENASPNPCKVMLQAGNWTQSIGGSVPVTVSLAPDKDLRLHFESLGATESPWGGTEDLFEPFALTAGPRPLFAEGLHIDSLSASGPAGPKVPRFVARAANDKSLLLIDHLKIGPEQMEITASGKGWLTRDGQKLTVDLMDRISKNPMTAALLATATSGLITWLWRIVAPRNKGQVVGVPTSMSEPPRHAG
jgi:hypothetical protein